MAKTFDGPPTLERSGSEHRRAVTFPLPEEEGLGEKVELSLQEKRRGRKNSFLNGKKGRGGFRKKLLLDKGRRRDSKKSYVRT